ncbi:MAG: hypothetical protein M3Q34_01835 [bacterium]|nr:hypothetical protein [bacterium]
MLSNILDRISFWSLFLVIVLLPVFFLPFTKIPVETSKGLLLVVGLVVSIIFWAAARFSDGKVVLPKSLILVSGLGVVLAFFVSALVNGTREMSLFGIMFDIGTFWSIFTAFLLMFFSSLIFKNKENAKVLLLGVLASLCVVFLFQIFHIFAPLTSSFGVLNGKTANLAGSWNSFGLLSVMGIIISLFLIEFYSISKKIKITLGIFLVLAVFMTMLVNFSLAWELLGIFALFVFVYKISYYSNQKSLENNSRKFPIFSFAIVLLSLLFFISGQFIGNYIPAKLGISNIEASPNFSSTMHVGNGAIKDNPVFGVGPNNFEQAWAKYKPSLVNVSQYWNTSFYTGSGLIPTFFITTGLLGTLFLLIFFYMLLTSGAKKLFVSMRSLENVEITIFFVSILFLTTASMFYAAGITIFLLLFAFTGVFVGLSAGTKENDEITISFLEDPRKSFFSILILVLIMVTSAGLSFKYIQRFASAEYFGKALLAQNSGDAFRYIVRAIELHQNDLYYRTYSQVELLMISEIIEKSKTKQLSEEEKAGLQVHYDKAVQGATLATQFNQKNSLNFELLGYVYHTVSNFGLTDAYDKAIESYKTAEKLSPLNPGVKLSIANALISKEMDKEAKESVAAALNLKPNYTEALIMMSQLEKKAGNESEALSYALLALQTMPNNKELADYVESLKNNTDAPVPVIDSAPSNLKTTPQGNSTPKQ